VTELVNDGLQMIAIATDVCLDDDHIPFVGSDATASLVPTRVDKRKGNGVPINTVTGGATSIVHSVSLEGAAKSTPKELAERNRLIPGSLKLALLLKLPQRRRRRRQGWRIYPQRPIVPQVALNREHLCRV